MAFGRNRLPAILKGLAIGSLLVLASCQSDSGSVLGIGGGSARPADPDPARITAEELRAYCPRVTLRSGTAFYNTFERGGDGDPAKVIYQASISDVTRSCTYNGGMLSMTVAAAGKVVPGPLAKAGAISMPIRIAVVRGEEVLFSELFQHQVQIAAGSAATQWVYSNPNISFPQPTAPNVQVFVGYDEGPAKTN